MAILRSLLVTLGLNSSKYRTDLSRTQRQTKSSLADMAKSAAKWSIAVSSSFAAATAASAVAATKAVRDQDNWSRIAGMNINDFKKLSFAATQYGSDVEKMAQLSKDAREKVGEFINAGTGGLVDFADAMGMTKKETMAWAKEANNLSGTQIFQKMVTEMEGAELSASQMSNALESLGNDATALIPLYSNNGAELDRLNKKYERFNENLSPEKVAQYRTAAEDIDLMTTSIANMASVALVPVIKKIYETGKAWEWLINSFREGTRENILSEMATVNDEIGKLEGELDNAGSAWGRLKNAATLTSTDKSYIQAQIDAKREEYQLLKDQYKKMEGLTFPESGAKTPVGNGDSKKPPKRLTVGESDLLDKSELKTMQELDDMIIEQALWRNGQLEIANQERVKNDKEANKKLQKEADSLVQLQYDQTTTMLNGIQSGFSQVAALAEEGSGLQKAMFLASQAAAVANVMVSSEQAKWMARSTIPSLAGQEIAARTIDINKYISLGSIAAQTVAGVFHGGGAVPKNNGEQTYLLKGGEYVESEAERRKIDSMVSGGGAGGSGGNTVQVVVQGNIYGDAETKRIISTAAKQGYTLVAQDFRGNGTISRTTKR